MIGQSAVSFSVAGEPLREALSEAGITLSDRVDKHIHISNDGGCCGRLINRNGAELHRQAGDGNERCNNADANTDDL